MAVFVVAHQKGGVGKTTLTFNLADYFRGFIPTEVIDLDSNKMFTNLNNLRILSNITPFNMIDVTSMGDEKFVEILNDYSGNPNKLLIVDSGGFDSVLNSRVAGAADFILTPVGNKTVEIIGLQKYEDVLTRIQTQKMNVGLGDEKLPCHVVINRLHHAIKNIDDSNIGRFLQTSEHYVLLNSIVTDRSSFDKTLAEGGYTVLEKGCYNSKREIVNLGQEIAEILYKNLEE